jgi:hypothetical protein
LPDRSRALVTDWANEVTAQATNSFDKAVAIQKHLRDTTRYTYSLDLGDPPLDNAGRPLEAVRAFYETRRGYCLHFATAMILMARAEGIPARIAVGYLPGKPVGNQYVVKQSDAHAWPELYFEGYGWMRFEPTPADRAPQPPAYTEQGAGPGGAGQEATGDTSTGTASSQGRKPAPGVNDRPGGASTGSQPDSSFTVRDILALTAVVVGLIAALLMPLTAKLVGLRRRRAARDEHELIEVEWDELTSHFRDLGLSPPPGGTLRQWRQHYVASGHLDSDNAEAIGRVTATLERARYARPERTSVEQATQLHRDIRSIRRDVAHTRNWRTRVRSFLWPSAGVAFWRRLRDSLKRRGPHSSMRGH